MALPDSRKVAQRELVYLVHGKSEGRPLWHYVAIDRLKQPLFEQTLKTERLDVAQFGRVLFSGWGENPPQDVVQSRRA